MIKGSVPRDLWKYVDPDTVDIYNELETVTIRTIKAGAAMLRELSAAEKTLYANLKISSKQDQSQYQRYLSEETKLRMKIMSTTTVTTRVLLEEERTTREWVSSLRSATNPTDAQMMQLIQACHRTLLGSKFVA
jgi:hypothetical protein